MGSWSWIIRYAVVLLVAVLLGTGIAELPVFKQTTLGTPKLPASALARVLGYGGALVIFWMLGQRTAAELRRAGGGAAQLGFLVVPLATLIVLSAGYDIGLTILRPFLGAGYKNAYNWLFVLGISASALWLVVALYQRSEGLVDLLKVARAHAPSAARKCESCGAALADEAKSCTACGKGLAEVDGAHTPAS
ncbi:MAG TPA: zinc ribbon domain-containing protein [Burkholderiales bacterium]|nr:zinc ribbon domain-containing protein [Burkholderiales bacterium]